MLSQLVSASVPVILEKKQLIPGELSQELSLFIQNSIYSDTSITCEKMRCLGTILHPTWRHHKIATPIGDFADIQTITRTLSRTYRTGFDSQAIAYLHPVTFDHLRCNHNVNDLFGRRTTGASAMQNGRWSALSFINAILVGDDLPRMVIPESFPEQDTVVIIGRRNGFSLPVLQSQIGIDGVTVLTNVVVLRGV